MTLSRAALDGPIAAAAGALVRGWRFRIWLAITTAFGIGVASLPLIGVLGFELALIASVFASLAAVDLGAALVRRVQATPPPPLSVAVSPLRLVAALTARAVVIGVVVALPFGVIAAVHGLWAITCDWGFGVLSYLALPIASAVLFAGLGVAIGLVTGPRRLLGNALPYIVVLAIAFAGLVRFYTEPPVFTYNPIIGYFPGNLYDEDIQLGMPLVWARLEALAWIIGVLALCAAQLDAPRFRATLRRLRPRALRNGAWGLALAALGAGLLIHLGGGTLGHGITAEDIQAELGGRLETPHFVIHYAKTPGVEADIALVAADHEFRYAQVVSRLGGVAVDGKIRSYYFATTDQKARLIGARNVEMAKPWRKEIYLDHRGFPHSSLRHEIAHVVAGELGDPIFGVSARRVVGLPVLINPGMIEGLAVAVDWPDKYDRSLTPDQSMRVIQALGHEPSVDNLLSLGFLTLSAQRSYTAAGSFLHFLLERYGIAPLRTVYGSGGDFAAAYGKSLRALSVEWRAYLATVEIPPEAVEAHRERFARGGVFDRPCPHATAKRRIQAAVRRDEGDRAGAIRLMRRVCDDQPSEPRHRLDLAGLLDAPEGTDAERAEGRAILEELAAPEGGPASVRADAVSDLTYAAAQAGDWVEVARLTAAALGLPLDDYNRRQVLGRWLALNHVGPAGPALRAYFFRTGSEPARALADAALAAEPALPLAAYLVGLRDEDTDDWRAAAGHLAAALDGGLPHPLFTRNAARRLAVDAYRAGDHALVERAIAVLTGAGPGMSEVDRLLGIDWSERLVFARSGALPAPALTSR